jgi:GNAT superfamily N-acetyltransferase
VMNDLFVTAEARGTGTADALIAACLEQCRERGAVSLTWQTARDNERAQAVYDRVGGRRSEWLDYSLDTGS